MHDRYKYLGYCYSGGRGDFSSEGVKRNSQCSRGKSEVQTEGPWKIICALCSCEKLHHDSELSRVKGHTYMGHTWYLSECL